jgi:Sec-independent protein secretion pathway component TatC
MTNMAAAAIGVAFALGLLVATPHWFTLLYLVVQAGLLLVATLTAAL